MRKERQRRLKPMTKEIEAAMQQTRQHFCPWCVSPLGNEEHQNITSPFCCVPNPTQFPTLSQFKLFQFDAVAPDLREVVLSLLHKPAFLRATKNLG
jgi:hypothetical protein